MFYKYLIRPILFKIDAEKVHNLAINSGKFFGNNRLIKFFLRRVYFYKNKELEQNILGINFSNPVGLAAGFDKNGKLTEIFPEIGFGFMEIGSITARYCEGNKKPRIWRLPKDKAIMVHYGLASEGVDNIYKRLKNLKFKIPLILSVAKTNDINIKGDDSVNDYYYSFKKLENLTDFITLNISCPNTGDGRSFQDPFLLEKLLKKIGKTDKKIFLKISPDIAEENIDKILLVIKNYDIKGFIIGNLLKKRENLKSSEDDLKGMSGSVSGPVAGKRSLELIRYVYEKIKGKYVIIGCGGITTAEEAYEMIKNGASLIQIVTSMIFEGPIVIKKINKGLVKLLRKDGYNNIKEAIGANLK